MFVSYEKQSDLVGRFLQNFNNIFIVFKHVDELLLAHNSIIVLVKLIKYCLSLQSRNHLLDLLQGKASIVIGVNVFEEIFQFLFSCQWSNYLEGHHQLPKAQ